VHIITGDHLEDAPRTIEDSITVTKALGYRYLWVDRYCIPQNDPQLKHRLIQAMDVIYKSSAVTFIAAAGQGPDYGLPGVSPGLRKAEAPTKIGPLILTPGDNSNFEVAFRSSKWNSRGWTYQG